MQPLITPPMHLTPRTATATPTSQATQTTAAITMRTTMHRMPAMWPVLLGLLQQV